MRPSGDAWPGRISGDAVRLLVFGRTIPAMFFLWLAYLQTLRLISDASLLPKPVTVPALVDGPIPVALYLVFCIIPVVIYGRPYHVIRHPLYAAEILAILSFAMLNPTLSIVALLAPFIATQLLRARYEEGLLMRVFPSYRTYASHTCRLIPFVW